MVTLSGSCSVSALATSRSGFSSMSCVSICGISLANAPLHVVRNANVEDRGYFHLWCNRVSRVVVPDCLVWGFTSAIVHFRPSLFSSNKIVGHVRLLPTSPRKTAKTSLIRIHPFAVHFSGRLPGCQHRKLRVVCRSPANTRAHPPSPVGRIQVPRQAVVYQTALCLGRIWRSFPE